MTEQKPSGNPPILLRIPPEIGKPLIRDAKKNKTTVQSVLLGIVMSHYGLAIELPVRGSKKGKKQ